jgi:hypothetical protein
VYGDKDSRTNAANGLELTCGARFTAPLCRPPRSAGDVRLNDLLCCCCKQETRCFYFWHADFRFLQKTPVANTISQAKIAAKPISNIFLFEDSNQLTSLDLQHNGLELTCGAVLMRARFAPDIELLLIENDTT